jgi:hypothetical protein
LSGLAGNTVYYWRVRAKNADGPGAWSSAWDFKTMIAAPIAPVLVLPANDATGVPTSLTLCWNTVSQASTYRAQIASDSLFSSILKDSTDISDTLLSLTSLANNITYYWRVLAQNAGGSSDWSSVWSFTTMIAAPVAPVLVAPSDDATGVPISLSLYWNTVNQATTYQAQIASDSLFTDILKDSAGIADTTLSLTNLANDAQCYWRVLAQNAGGASDWSVVWSFTTEALVPVELTSFAAEAHDADIILSWSTATEQGNLGWNILRSTTAQGTFVKINAQLVPGNGTVALPHAYTYTDNPAATGTYYYRLEQIDLNGNKILSPMIAAVISAISYMVIPVKPVMMTFTGKQPAAAYNLQGLKVELAKAPTGIYFSQTKDVKFLVVNGRVIDAKRK